MHLPLWLLLLLERGERRGATCPWETTGLKLTGRGDVSFGSRRRSTLHVKKRRGEEEEAYDGREKELEEEEEEGVDCLSRAESGGEGGFFRSSEVRSHVLGE